jgi:urease accessory protein
MTASRLTAVILALGLLPSLALAHPGHETPGFVAGLLHPLTGLDHLLAILAVGGWAAATRLAGGWRVPASFATGMLAGALLGLAGLRLPAAELLIALSLLVFGSLMMLRRTLALAPACALAGGLALFHGYAHGAELPASADTVAWLSGMVTATVLLHLAGAALALASRRHPLGLRLAGAAVAAAGGGLLLGL